MNTNAIVCDKYAREIAEDTKGIRYTSVVVLGVRNLGDPATDETQWEEDAENPEMYSVFLRSEDGDLECVGDFTKLTRAIDYCTEVAAECHTVGLGDYQKLWMKVAWAFARLHETGAHPMVALSEHHSTQITDTGLCLAARMIARSEEEQYHLLQHISEYGDNGRLGAGYWWDTNPENAIKRARVAIALAAKYS